MKDTAHGIATKAEAVSAVYGAYKAASKMTPDPEEGDITGVSGDTDTPPNAPESDSAAGSTESTDRMNHAPPPVSIPQNDQASQPRTSGDDSPEQSETSNVQDGQPVKATKLTQAEEAEAGTKMMKVMWKLTVIDVENTVRGVVQYVLQDETVSAAGRHKRAQGIIALGNLYVEAAEATGDIHARAAEAMNATISGSGPPFGFGAAENPAAWDEEQESSSQGMPSIDEVRVQLKELPVGQLKKLCEEGGIDCSDCVEKSDLVERVIVMMTSES